MKIFINFTIITVIAILTYVFIIRDNLSKDSSVKYVYARKRTIENFLILPGSIKPGEEIDIKSNISGIITKTYVAVGDAVKAGDPLVQINVVGEPIEYEKLLQSSEGIIAQYEYNKRLYNTNKGLYEKKVISKLEFDKIETDYKSISSQYELTKTELALLSGKQSTKYSSTIIRATSDGTVLELPIKQGGSVLSKNMYGEGTTIAKLANLKVLSYIGAVSEKDISQLKLGDTLYLALSAIKNTNIPAVIRTISPKGSETEGSVFFTITANIIMDNKIPIRAGYSANAKILIDKAKNVLSIEEKYLKFKDDTSYVEIFSNNSIQKKNVKIGLSDGINCQILSGLSPKDKVTNQGVSN